MNFKLSLVLAVCLVELVSCGPEDLYNQVFVETSPPLDRAEVIKMLIDLKGIYQEDPEKKTRIDDVLERSQISEDRCGRYFFIGEVKGRAGDLLKETKLAQAEVCKNLWQTSALQSIASSDKGDEIFANSLIKSMIKANGGRDFAGEYLDNMPYLAAQKGVLRFIEQQSKKKLSSWTGKDKFDKLFDTYVSEPCGRIVGRLDNVIKGYVDLVRFDNEKQPTLDPVALDWVKKGLICRQIRGFGYSSMMYHSFRIDLFYNLIRKNLRD